MYNEINRVVPNLIYCGYYVGFVIMYNTHMHYSDNERASVTLYTEIIINFVTTHKTNNTIFQFMKPQNCSVLTYEGCTEYICSF
jgi:hypothetical protein